MPGAAAVAGVGRSCREERNGEVSATAYVLPTVLCAVGGFGERVAAGVRAKGLPAWFDAACAQVQVSSWRELDVEQVSRGEVVALRQAPFDRGAVTARERNRLCVAVLADLRRGWATGADAEGWSALVEIRERLRAEREGIHRDALVVARGPVPPAVLAGAAAANVAVLQVTDTDCEGRVWDEEWVVAAGADAVIALVAAGLVARSEWGLGRGVSLPSDRYGIGCRLESAERVPDALAPRLAALTRRGARAILGFSPDRPPRPEDDARTVLAHFPPRLHLSEFARHADILRHRSTHLDRIGRGPAAAWPDGVAAAEAFLSGRHVAWVARAFAELERGCAERYLQALDGMLASYARSYVRPSWMQELCDQVRRQVLADAPRSAPSGFVAVPALEAPLRQKLAQRVPREASALLTAIGALFVGVYVRLFAPSLLRGVWLVPLALLVLAPALGLAMDEWRIRHNLRALRDAVHDKYRRAEDVLRQEAERRVRAALVAAVDARKAGLVAFAKALQDVAQGGPTEAAVDVGLRPDACPSLDPLGTPVDAVLPALRRWAEGIVGLDDAGSALRQPGTEGWLAVWDRATPLVSPPPSRQRDEAVFQFVPEAWGDEAMERPDGGDGPATLRWGLPLYGTLRLVRWQADERRQPGAGPHVGGLPAGGVPTGGSVAGGSAVGGSPARGRSVARTQPSGRSVAGSAAGGCL